MQIAQASETHVAAETTTSSKPWFSIQWHITSRCNQRCKHCYDVNRPDYQSDLANELSLADCKTVLDSLVEFCDVAGARPTACITGGDPLVRKDVFGVFEYAHELGVPFRILGNPYLLNEENLARMKELGLRSYQVSIDGMKEKHDWLRKPGSFDATCESIQTLKKQDVQSIVMFTLSRQNAADLLPVISLCCELGVDIFAFARYCTPSTPVLRSESFTPKEYRQLLVDVDTHVKVLKERDCETRFNRKDHLWKLLLYERGELDLSNPQEQILRGCHLGQHLNILPDGTVYACRRFNSPIGKVPEQSLLKIYVSDDMECYRRIESLEKCRLCPLLKHCRGCPAASYAESGRWQAADPQCWWKPVSEEISNTRASD